MFPEATEGLFWPHTLGDLDTLRVSYGPRGGAGAESLRPGSRRDIGSVSW